MGRTLLAGLLSAAVLTLAGGASSWAQEEDNQLTAARILQMIEDNGAYAYAEAAAGIDIARARLDEASAGLYPSLSLSATGQRFRSSSLSVTDNDEAYGALEVVQPIYDFGRTGAAVDAAGSDVKAAEQALITARNTVLLEGLALFFDLHASELQLRAYNETHASAYVRWDRVKEQLELGRASPVEVSQALALVEKTRLDYFRELSRNNIYRIRLEELIGGDLPEELIFPPPPPEKPPLDVIREDFAQAVMERNPDIVALTRQIEAASARRGGVSNLPSLDAFGSLGKTSRDVSGRNEYAVGARLSWSIFDGGLQGATRNRLAAEESRLNARLETTRRQLRLKAHKAMMDRDVSYQRVVSAKAGLDYSAKNLLRRQQLYSQERVADLGRAMIENSAAEAELIRATGAYQMERARIAMLLGEHPGQGLAADFLASVLGQQDAPSDDYIPKGGSGYGQEDQDKVNRNVE